MRRAENIALYAKSIFLAHRGLDLDNLLFSFEGATISISLHISAKNDYYQYIIPNISSKGTLFNFLNDLIKNVEKISKTHIVNYTVKGAENRMLATFGNGYKDFVYHRFNLSHQTPSSTKNTYKKIIKEMSDKENLKIVHNMVLKLKPQDVMDDMLSCMVNVNLKFKAFTVF